MHQSIAWLALLASLGCSVDRVEKASVETNAGNGEVRLAIDQSRPFVEIVFERVGARAPVVEGESSYGLWLKVLNDCRCRAAIPEGPVQGQGARGPLLAFSVVPDEQFQVRPFDRPTAFGDLAGEAPRMVVIAPAGEVIFDLPLEAFSTESIVVALVIVGGCTPVTASISK